MCSFLWLVSSVFAALGPAMGVASDIGVADGGGDAFVQEGWRMVDRFHGFRFELEGKVQGVGFRNAIKEKADEIPCFGWVQNTAKGTVVGEARCSKRRGVDMEEMLRSGGPPGSRVDAARIKVYPSTKIKLLFPDFVILPDARVTCFDDEPHKCPDDAIRDIVDENIIWPDGEWPEDDDFEWDPELFAPHDGDYRDGSVGARQHQEL